MAKTKSNRCHGGAKQTPNWSIADHDARTNKRIASLNKRRRKQQNKQLALESDAPQPDHHDEPAASRPTKQQKQQQQPPHHEQPLHQSRPIKKAHRDNHDRLSSQVPEDTYKRGHLAHDNFDKVDAAKSRLATAQVQRKIDALKERLEDWDPVEEARLLAAQETEDKNSIEYKMKLDAQYRLEDREARQKAASEYNLMYAQHGVNSSNNRRKANLKKKPRPGPESWKLRGAARPAWEVYDFDTRYVDVHIQAHEKANERARRVKNVFSLCRGRFALEDHDDDDSDDNTSKNKQQKLFLPPQPHCREYLSLLTQLGSLQLHRKNYSSARKSYLEAIELEGVARPYSITNARYQLMNMYLTTNRPSSARKLWNSLENDGSAWVRYSAALIEYVSWNLLHEEGSSAESAERLLAQAIRGNVYVAYFLGWPNMFEKAMEYTHEVVEGGLLDSKSGSMLEAIEYGCCCYSSGEDSMEEVERGMGMWLGTEGSLDWVRSVVLRVLNNEGGVGGGSKNDNEVNVGGVPLTKADLLSWETKLSKEEEEHELERTEKERPPQEYDRDGKNDESDDGSNEDEEEPDVVMFGGMFRTSMDWLQDAGDFLKQPSFDYLNDEDAGDDATKTDDVADEDEKVKGDNNDDGGGSDVGGNSDGSDDDDSSDESIGSSSREEGENNDIAQDQGKDGDDGSASSSNSTDSSDPE
mmetsp:Transcript_27635/g.49782  ORF Transcript_27635/g.49782 Transcript_27635/m.49782 type:complete len:696 (+) Transcript_27635:17-2104(+)